MGGKMTEIYCRGCRKVTGYLEKGSKLAKGTEHICPVCVKKLNLKLAADKLKEATDKVNKPFGDLFGDMFGGGFNK